MNEPEKIIKAVIFPLIIIVIITLGIGKIVSGFYYAYYRYASPFDFGHTWDIWVISLYIIYKIELKLFCKTKNDSEQKK